MLKLTHINLSSTLGRKVKLFDAMVLDIGVKFRSKNVAENVLLNIYEQEIRGTKEGTDEWILKTCINQIAKYRPRSYSNTTQCGN